VSSLLPPGTAAAVRRNLTPEPERELPTDGKVWVRDELGEHLWSKQRVIFDAVRDHRHVIVSAAHDVSKSHTASRLAAFWIAAHPPGEAFVVSAAPTQNQVVGILWREIGRAHRLGGLPGRITLDGRWFIGPQGSEELVGFGRKPADMVDTDQAMQAFQGIHARYVLVILDEGTGVPGWLWDAAESLATNEGSRILAIGNPDDPSSRFAENLKPGSGWHVIQVSAFDSPNFTGEWVPENLRELLVSRQWVEERRERWGEDSPLWQSKVLGQVPDVADDLVIGPALIRRARELDLPGSGRGSYGLDVARMGEDRTVLYRNRGGVVRREFECRKQDTHTTRMQVQAVAKQGVPMAVDIDGLGGPVHDELKAAGVPVLGFTMTAKVRQPWRFANRRSEMWWAMREALEESLIDLDPEDDELAADLQAPKWKLDHRGRIVIETKDEMAKRGKKSPDYGDSAIMAVFGLRSPLGDDGAYVSPSPPRKNGAGRGITSGLLKAEM
jgi:hypothetical protein